MANPKNGTHTPMMQQYWDIKSQHEDKVLLYRMGDFYEMFFDDAIKAAPILNIALTSRSKAQGVDVPMCGVPHHSVGPQINKLLEAGIKVAICDQVEDPAQAKGIVKRAVTRVVTPGMVYDPETLDSSQSLFVAGVVKNGESSFSLAVLDASTGEFFTDGNLSRGELSESLQKFNVREIVVESEADLPFLSPVLLTLRDRNRDEAVETYLLRYARETQGEEILKTVRVPVAIQKDGLRLSSVTQRHLEVFKCNDGSETATLFSTTNLTRTPMGSRLYRKRLALPFGALTQVTEALNNTEFYLTRSELRVALRGLLGDVGDLERKVARLSNPLCNGRDLQSLARALQAVCNLIVKSELYRVNTSDARSLSDKILKILRVELPHSVKEGGLVNPGVSSTLDEYVDLATHAQTKLSELEARERQNSGIQSLKIKYNSVFGYSFEITKANLDRVPSHFVRRQTLAQGERFVTQELSDLEGKILSSQQKRCDLEYQIFSELRQLALSQAANLLSLCSTVAQLDLSLSFAQLAFERNYCRPQFQNAAIDLKDSRHPVLEQGGGEVFIPNDIFLEGEHCLLLTGPNMAGKSTLMRQVALTAILAQCGSYVPASKASLPLFDEIFTRIGASDNLALGLSTFMVEMTETAAIVERATPRSLVILDEIGRGTSTYDGMSLAQAVLEHFLSQVRSFTFFATHYHELTHLTAQWRTIVSAHMSIKEHKGELVFLRKLKNGPANRSYGIEVARAAGLPPSLTSRAKEILNGLDAKGRELSHSQLSLSPPPEQDASKAKILSDELEKIEINHLTPMEALNKLSQLKNLWLN